MITIENKDCFEALSSISGSSIDAVITDPPYFCGMTHNGKKGDFSDLNITEPFFKGVFEHFKRVLKPNGEVYMFCDWRTYAFYYPLLIQFLDVRNCIVWDKKSGPGNHYSYSHELIIFATHPSPTYRKHKKGRNIWVEPAFCSGAKKTNGDKVHPTQKPIELMERLVEAATEEGDTVLDAFAGSGTTAIACKNLGRKFIGFERNSKYYEIARARCAG